MKCDVYKAFNYLKRSCTLEGKCYIAISFFCGNEPISFIKYIGCDDTILAPSFSSNFPKIYNETAAYDYVRWLYYIQNNTIYNIVDMHIEKTEEFPKDRIITFLDDSDKTSEKENQYPIIRYNEDESCIITRIRPSGILAHDYLIYSVSQTISSILSNNIFLFSSLHDLLEILSSHYDTNEIEHFVIYELSIPEYVTPDMFSDLYNSDLNRIANMQLIGQVPDLIMNYQNINNKK